MDNQTFTPEESIKLIQSMIDQAKHNVKENSFYFLMWGWLVFSASILHFFLLEFTSFNQPYIIWNLMWIGAIITIKRGIKNRKQSIVKTYVAETMNYYVIGLFLIYAGLAFIFSIYDLWFYSFPFYILIYSVACFFIGSLIKLSLLKWMGVFCVLIALLSVYVSFNWQIFLMALSVLVSYIIPGHILRANEKYKNK